MFLSSLAICETACSLSQSLFWAFVLTVEFKMDCFFGPFNRVSKVSNVNAQPKGKDHCCPKMLYTNLETRDFNLFG